MMYHDIGAEFTKRYAFLYHIIRGIFCKQNPNTYFKDCAHDRRRRGPEVTVLNPSDKPE